MRTIRHSLVAFASAMLFVGSAIAQPPRVSTSTAAALTPAPEKSFAEQVCEGALKEGATYTGYEYRDGRNVHVTIKYTFCTDMPATHGRQKVQVHFDRQESGAALLKGQMLEFYVDSATYLVWRNMSGMYKEKTRTLTINVDGSYLEKLEYMNGQKADIHFKRK